MEPAARIASHLGASRCPEMPPRSSNVVEVVAEPLIPRLVQAYQLVTGKTPGARPFVSFYRYASTKSTIRMKGQQIRLRMSDHLKDAPDEVLDGLMQLLVCRLENLPDKRADAHGLRAYHEYVDSEKVSQRRVESRTSRGRKHIDPVGTHRSLLESFMRVVLDHDIRLPHAPKLSWTATRSLRRFGHHDGDVNAIVISQALDDPDVPEFVLDYVVYHELLHIVHPPRMGSGTKRMVHPPEFKAAEAQYARMDEANAWLTALSSGRKAKRIKI